MNNSFDMLSKRATAYLSTLERVKAIPTNEVKKIIEDSGYPCFEPWLDFHERYAGYVEPIGLDSAIWGLAHEKNYWIGDRSVFIEKEPQQDTWYIMCADVHPSYQYMLNNKGEFLGLDAESFDIHVERCALVWEFALNKKTKRLDKDELKAFDLSLLREGDLIKETMDKYFVYYKVGDKLIFKNNETQKIVKGFKILN